MTLIILSIILLTAVYTPSAINNTNIDYVFEGIGSSCKTCKNYALIHFDTGEVAAIFRKMYSSYRLYDRLNKMYWSTVYITRSNYLSEVPCVIFSATIYKATNNIPCDSEAIHLNKIVPAHVLILLVFKLYFAGICVHNMILLSWLSCI